MPQGKQLELIQSSNEDTRKLNMRYGMVREAQLGGLSAGAHNSAVALYVQIMQHQNIKVAWQPSHYDFSTNLTPFPIELNLGIINFASAAFNCFFD
jgi:hypothetical protein